MGYGAIRDCFSVHDLFFFHIPEPSGIGYNFCEAAWWLWWPAWRRCGLSQWMEPSQRDPDKDDGLDDAGAKQGDA